MVKDWLEAAYATVRYWVDPRFRRQVKLYRVMIERAMLGAEYYPEYYLDEVVYFDDDRGAVKDFLESGRGAGSYDYLVRWDNGHMSWVWGSDLMSEAERAAFDAQ